MMFCKRCGCPETPDPVDFGPRPLVVDLPGALDRNGNFRAALWTGEHLQMTLMSIPVDGEIGLEIHPDVDQFIFVGEGCGTVKMGSEKENMTFVRNIFRNDAIFVPAGTWHNIVNTGSRPMKLSSVYAPPEHPRGTLHRTRAEAEQAEAAEKTEAASPAQPAASACAQSPGTAAAAAASAQEAVSAETETAGT